MHQSCPHQRERVLHFCRIQGISLYSQSMLHCDNDNTNLFRPGKLHLPSRNGVIPKLKLKHPSTTIRPFPGPSFIDYGRMTVRPILHQKIRQLQKSNKLTVKLNNAGFRLGQHVRIRWDNANSFWQRYYKPSELVGKRGYIVGCTPCYVHVAMGNVWSAYVNIIRKKNECVVLEYI